MAQLTKIFSSTESARRRSAIEAGSVSNPRLGARARAVDTHGTGRRKNDGRCEAPVPTARALAKMETNENENERFDGKARPPGGGHAPTD